MTDAKKPTEETKKEHPVFSAVKPSATKGAPSSAAAPSQTPYSPDQRPTPEQLPEKDKPIYEKEVMIYAPMAQKHAARVTFLADPVQVYPFLVDCSCGFQSRQLTEENATKAANDHLTTKAPFGTIVDTPKPEAPAPAKSVEAPKPVEKESEPVKP